MAPEWGKVTIRDIALAINGILAGGRDDIKVLGISTDSRTIKRGQIFWALQGERFDGHDYIENALEAGASGVVVSRKELVKKWGGTDCCVIYVNDTLKALGDLASWWRKGHRALVAGITGSAGKTTTKEMIALILGTRHQVLKNHGNLNNLIGLPMTLLRLGRQHGRAVVEMGMNRPGEIARLTQVADPDIGLITNVGKAHLEGLGDLLGVARAKLEMAQHLREDAILILNGDDQVLMECASGIEREFATFGFGPNNHFRADNVNFREHGNAEFEIIFKNQRKKIRLKVPGVQNVMNALAAASVTLSMGETLEAVCTGLEQFKGIKGRFVLRDLGKGITLIDDTYNANPLSLRAALDSLGRMVGRFDSVIIGLSDMLELGSEAKELHYEAGKWVGQLGPKLLVVTGELAREMAKAAVESGLSHSQVYAAKDTEEMTEVIKKSLRPGDTILLKGSRRTGLDKVVDGLSLN